MCSMRWWHCSIRRCQGSSAPPRTGCVSKSPTASRPGRTGKRCSMTCWRFSSTHRSRMRMWADHFFAEEGLSTCTHVTDQHTTYGTKVIVATRREAHYVLDEILGSATDLPITEHATDIHGVTLVNFALFDLLGMRLSPHIRDLGKITLYRPVPRGSRCRTRSFPVRA
ncbi:Tn3 family transposase [Nocardia sp. NPDC059764]|uniref:Tn3 family transposase n=1 Tax=Nocardia sp. NPDC059764 TaxID=3346939 RepID=UPI003664CAB9